MRGSRPRAALGVLRWTRRQRTWKGSGQTSNSQMRADEKRRCLGAMLGDPSSIDGTW